MEKIKQALKNSQHTFVFKGKQWLMCTFLLAFVFSCKKEHAPVDTISGSPVFYFNGTIGGTPTSFSAGIGGYYMFTSYVQDSSLVYQFTGNLQPVNQANSSISITLNDQRVSAPNAAVNIDSALFPGNYLYDIPGITNYTVYNVYFSASTSNGSPQNYQWNFGDGQTLTTSSGQTMHTYQNPGIYPASLNVNYAGACSSTANQAVNTNPGQISARIAYTVDTSNVFHFSSSSNILHSLYSWNFGDGSSSLSGSLVSHYYTTAGAYQVSLHAKDSTNQADSSVTSLNVLALGYSHCVTNFTDSVKSQLVNASLHLSNVIVRYTDASGVLYRSDNSNQPSGSSFQIVSEEPYQLNAQGQKTRKLHVKFSCWVYSLSGSSLQINNADAVIAVAYK